MEIKISVIIATHNCGKYISKALESVLKQTLQQWEIIIIDDGSTDNSYEIIKPFLKDKRIKYKYQEKSGLSRARNLGIKLSYGEMIQFLDADDFIHPEKFERQALYLDNNKNVEVVFSSYSFFINNNYDFFINIYPQKPILNILNELLKGNFIAVNSALVRKNAILRIGGFDENLTSTEDWDLWLRMALSGMNIKQLKDKLAFVRIHSDQMSKNKLNMFMGRYHVIRKNITLVPRCSPYWESAKSCYIRSKLGLAREYLLKRKIKETKKIILEKPNYINLKGIKDFLIESLFQVKRII